MKIAYSQVFLKNFKKRIAPHIALENKFFERIKLFNQNPNDPILKNHKLHGSKQNYRAFSITGDVRVIFSIENNSYYFLDIGTHNQVYK